jgi:hypothetical protein
MDGRCRPAWVAGFLFTVILGGCGTMQNGKGWGQDATLAPGWDRVGRAAWNAAKAPETWVPAAGAAAFQIGHADQKVSDWATRTTPVFGSPDRAGRASDLLLGTSEVLWIASGLATPSGDGTGEWLLNKGGGFGVQVGSLFLLQSTVGSLKSATDRTRPNGEPNSFPSGHASMTADFATMTSKNVEAMEWSGTTTTVTQFGLGAMTAATAWARVEAGYHYPSDVLAGAALGHFFGAFFTDAFLGIDDPGRALVLFEPSRDGVIALVRLGF